MYDGFGIFESPDMKQWNLVGNIQIDDMKECPDMFRLKHGSVKKWILMATEGKYVIGDFDGKQFKIESDVKRFAYGNTYASQTWNDNNEEKKYIIFRLGDMSEQSKDISQMSLTMELALEKYQFGDEYYLSCKPIEKYNEIIHHELKKIRDEYVSYEEINLNLNPNLNLNFNNAHTPIFMIIMTIRNIVRKSIIETANGNIEYDHQKSELKYKNIYTKIDPCPNNEDHVNLKIIFDTNSIEIYNNDNIYIGYGTNGNQNDKITLINLDIEEFVIYVPDQS